MLKKDRYKMTSNLKNMFLTYIRNEMKKKALVMQGRLEIL